MRTYLADYFLSRAQSCDDFVILSGDHGYALFDPVRREKSDKFINVGIAEQNMIGLAAGMTIEGLRPMVYGLASFIPIRVLEQIKLDLCYPKHPVILLGDGAGLVYGKLGVSHQCLEDIAALRSLPNISIFSPADKFELASCLTWAESYSGPSYIRIGKADLSSVHSKNLTMEELAAGLIPVNTPPASKSSNAVAIVATGSMVVSALEIAKRFGARQFDVFSVPLLKPLSKEKIVATLHRYSRVFTYEEHCEVGGLGSIITEALSECELPVRVCRIGSPLMFSETVGSHSFLLKQHGLDVDTVHLKIKEFL